mmetsp:Transcript_29277/g.79233  ORF Transcript_29277/g.79233 Transcript_29277/m.79233 type:complete len:869 (-) Transcript_29277:1448-4054(-)
MFAYPNNFDHGGDSEINDSDLVGSSFSSSASSEGTSPCDNSKDDEEDACLEEVQQGFLGTEPHSKKAHLKATPKTLFGGSGDGLDNDLYQHDRNSSDSNSSTDDRNSRRVAMIMASTTLPPRNNSSREKHRRRTRSSSRRSNSSSLSESPLSDDYALDYENDHAKSPLPVRRRSPQSGSMSSSHKRRSHFPNNKRSSTQSFDNFDTQKFGNPVPYSNAPDYSSPSESSPDSSPSRSATDMYRVQQHNVHHTPSSQEKQFSTPRTSSKSSLSRSGSDSPIGGGSPYGSSLHSTRSPMSRSPSTAKLSNAKAKLLTTGKSWCLMGTFVGMVLLSLSGMILLTNQAVPANNSPEVYVPNLPDRSDDSGLRGKKVLGRMWDTSATSSEDTTSNIKKKIPGKHPESTQQGGTPSVDREKKEQKSVTRTRAMPQRYQMRMPPSISIDLESRFDEVDPNLYHTSSSSEMDAKPDFIPRIVVLHPPVQPIARKIETYPADFTDNTQLYGILPSDDERLNRMEIRDPYSTDECVPMQDWQTAYQPSCNGMHELALQTLGASTGQKGEKHKLRRGEVEGLDASLFGTKGFWRYAWKLVIGHHDHRKAEEDTIVFKNLKYEHNFEDAHFEHDRVDAVAMERLTSSPHVINIFGFCGHSVLTEYADGKRLGELADKSKKTPMKRLEIARDIANGLADVHGIDGDGNTTFVHLDVNPANVVSVNQTLKLNDFNIGIIRQWNTTSNEACGFPTQYPNPQWRSPEEARNEQHLTEKVDIFSLGHIFFRLICGHEPWNKLEPGGRPTKEEINEKVQRGDLPFIPNDVMNSEDPEIVAIRGVMLKCYRFDPTQRPSARQIADTLDGALQKLQRKYLKKAKNAKTE